MSDSLSFKKFLQPFVSVCDVTLSRRAMSKVGLMYLNCKQCCLQGFDTAWDGRKLISIAE